MDLRINGYNPSFGMAVQKTKEVLPIIKKQALSMPENSQGYNFRNFTTELNYIVSRQAENPNNIRLKRYRWYSGRMAAEVVDANGVNKKTFSQPWNYKNGDLKFLNDAENYANRLQALNKNLDNIPTVELKKAPVKKVQAPEMPADAEELARIGMETEA